MQPSDRRALAAVVGALFLVLAPGAFLGVPGKSVAGAWRVLAGEVPYRDFWTMYAPGQFYAVAFVLWICGRQIAAPALVACALKAGTSGVWFATLRDAGATKRVALTVPLVLGLAQFEIAPELSSYPPALFAISLAWRRALRGGSSDLLVAGALLGVGAIFKHDVAGYAALGLVVGLVAASVRAQGFSMGAAAGIAARVFTPALGIVILVAAWLAVVAGVDAWRDLIVFPLGDFPLVRSEAYPGFAPPLGLLREMAASPESLSKARDAAEALAEWGLANAPQFAFVAALVFLLRLRPRAASKSTTLACIALASIPFYWHAAHTQQNTHLLTMAVLSGLAGAALREHWRASKGWSAAAWLIAALYVFSLSIRPAAELALPLRAWSRVVPLGLPCARGVHVSPREREIYNAVADYVNEHVPPGEPIHLGVARHDAIVINNPRFGYLVDRPIATRYHELHPGVTDREDVQREMIADLERKNVRCAVIWRFGWPQKTLDAITSRRTALIPECGAKLLDEYFAERFEPVLEVDEYVVLRRR